MLLSNSSIVSFARAGAAERAASANYFAMVVDPFAALVTKDPGDGTARPVLFGDIYPNSLDLE